jgi:glycosyltransferase involved in cell wall biosynthesis
VLASNASSIPEVAGHGARYFDPRSERELHAALSAVLSEPEQTQRLVEAGKANEQRFSWETTASLTLDAYRQAMG